MATPGHRFPSASKGQGIPSDAAVHSEYHTNTQHSMIHTHSYTRLLTVQFSHCLLGRHGVLKFDESVAILHQNLPNLAVLPKEGPDRLLVTLGREVPHVELRHDGCLLVRTR